MGRSPFKMSFENLHLPARSYSSFVQNLAGNGMLVAVCLLLVATLSNACEYRRLDPGHTMCIYNARTCGGKNLLRSGGISCQEKQSILETHNRLRQMLALGQIRGQPAALDMRELVWDEELASVAQRWADQCKAGHDRRRVVDRFSVGQNVATTWTYDKPSASGDEPEFKKQIEAWFNEVTSVGFKGQDVDPFVFNRQAGHYTQIGWSETYQVGCGYSYFKDPQRGYTKLYVCNYGPGGNIIGASMYRVGRAGQTMCANDNLRSSARYPGLCEISYGADYKVANCPAPQPTTEQTVVSLATGKQPNYVKSTQQKTTPVVTTQQQPTIGEILIRGLQAPFAGLAKILSPYNLFG